MTSTTEHDQSEYNQPTVEQDLRYSQALWYAWGRGDGGEPLNGTAFDFASQYARRYARFERGRTVSMPSMMDCFANWQSGRPLDGKSVPTTAGHIDRRTGQPATVYTPPEDLVEAYWHPVHPDEAAHPEPTGNRGPR
jgi:hypothetical protein